MVWCATRCLEGQTVGQGELVAGDAGEAGLMDEIKAQLCRAADPQMLDCVLLPPSKARVAMMLELLRSS